MMWHAVAEASQVQTLSQYGPLGVFAAVALTFYALVYRAQESRITDAIERGERATAAADARADRVQERLDALQAQVMGQVIPVVTQAVTVMGTLLERQRIQEWESRQRGGS